MLNANLISQRRRLLSLPMRELGAMVGVSATLIKNLEAGSSHDSVNMRLLGRLADALQVDPATLLATEGHAETSEIAEQSSDCLPALMSALLTADGLVPQQDLVRLTGMSAQEVQAQMKAAGPALAAVGIHAYRSPRGEYGLRPAQHLSDQQRGWLGRSKLRRRGLSVSEARLLAEVLDGPIRPPQDTNSVMATGYLQNCDVLEQESGRLVLAEGVAFSLLLDD